MIQVFLDTNVIIDYLGNRTGFYDDAAIIMSLAINQKIELHAAAMSFATASYILSKKNDNNRENEEAHRSYFANMQKQAKEQRQKFNLIP